MALRIGLRRRAARHPGVERIVQRKGRQSVGTPVRNQSRHYEVLTSKMTMPKQVGLRCDGCGQVASPEHTARRLQRLEWATRFRPVHIRALLLGAVGPREDNEFLYAPGCQFQGEAAMLLRALGIHSEGKPTEAVQMEVQAAGFFLGHVLECPLENDLSAMTDGPDGEGRRRKAAATRATELLRERLPFAASRIRRSLKPKCVIPVTEKLEPFVQDIVSLDLSCPVILNDGKPFDFSDSAGEQEFLRFREALNGIGNR